MRTRSSGSRAVPLAAALLVLNGIDTAVAGDVSIVAAEFRSSGGNHWSVEVTLQHDDTGWAHYADSWRVVDGGGNVLGERILHHPHVEEQPFSRGLPGVQIPDGIATVYIEAHDRVHGWSPGRLRADLGKAIDGRLRVGPD